MCGKQSNEALKDYGFFLKCCILLYIVGGFASSSYLKSSVNYMFVGSMAGISCVIENKVSLANSRRQRRLPNVRARTGRSEVRGRIGSALIVPLRTEKHHGKQLLQNEDLHTVSYRPVLFYADGQDSPAESCLPPRV